MKPDIAQTRPPRLSEAQRAEADVLYELGVFNRAQLAPDLRGAPGAKVAPFSTKTDSRWHRNGKMQRAAFFRFFRVRMSFVAWVPD